MNIDREQRLVGRERALQRRLEQLPPGFPGREAIERALAALRAPLVRTTAVASALRSAPRGA